MKPILKALLLASLFPAFALADDALANQINNKRQELNGLIAEIKNLDASASGLNAEKAHLSDTSDLLKGAEANLDKKNDDWGNRAQNQYITPLNKHQAWVHDLENRVRDHNSRCGGTYSDTGYVNSCNAEKGRLDAEDAQIRQDT